jgi:uncharacterized protein YbjT (DUF2867 family)
MILVAGATGALGGSVARSLLADGRPVRALVRPGSDHATLIDAGAHIAAGDLKDPPSLARACAGVTTVVTTANSAGRSGADTTDTVDRHGNRALIDAAAAAGVSHFVFVSALGAAVDSPVDFLRAKGEAEAHLRASGMRYTIVQPDIFMEVWFGMIVAMPLQQGLPITLVEPARARHTFVSSGDVAAFVAGAVTRSTAASETIVVGGPEPLSWQDVVETAGHVVGQTLRVNYVAPGTPLPGLPEVVSHLAAGFESYETVLDMTETAATFGLRLTTAAECLTRMLRPQVSA